MTAPHCDPQSQASGACDLVVIGPVADVAVCALAAGCTIEGDPEQVLADLVEALRPQLEG